MMFETGRLDSDGMNPSPRQLDLVEEVQRLRSVSVEALAERFGVTLQTVRRLSLIHISEPTRPY